MEELLPLKAYPFTLNIEFVFVTLGNLRINNTFPLKGGKEQLLPYTCRCERE